MSKKNYFEPEMEVVEVKVSQMLCGSPNQGGVGEDGESGSGDDPEDDIF
jgi:hypothetical protein